MHEDIERAIRETAPFTMVAPHNVAFTIECVFEAIDTGIPGEIVECGTWKGGSSFAMLLAQRYRYGKILRPVWMFDSFEGLPPVDERDGPAAAAYQANVDSPHYFDNCTAPLADVLQAIEAFGLSAEEAIVVPGWFHETIPGELGELAQKQIAFLRIDCDWYDPVSYVLREMTPMLSNGGRVLLDDYYAWDGCSRATHDFLAKLGHAWRIQSMPQLGGAFMVKRA